MRKKRRPRDFDDEDYEEPIQPRRVSARKSAQAAAQLGARPSYLRMPDKKGKPGQKGIARVDSMSFAVRPLHCPLESDANSSSIAWRPQPACCPLAQTLAIYCPTCHSTPSR